MDATDRLGTGAQRPSLASGRSIDTVVTGDINRWFDATAFTLPSPGTLGTAGRNSVTGPDFMTIDLALQKNIRLGGRGGDRASIQLRAEAFNVTNRTNFGQPNANVFVQAPNGGATYSPTAGRITTLASTARQMQFAIKLVF